MPCLLIALAVLSTSTTHAAIQDKDLRTKEQRLYEIQLREAQWQVDNAKLDMEIRLSDYEENKDLFDQRIRTLNELNRFSLAYQKAKLAYDQAVIALEETRLSFLRQATHITILEAKKYRTPEGYRNVEVAIQNDSNLDQARLLNPDKSADQVRALLEVQNVAVIIERADSLIVGDPYEQLIPSLKLKERVLLTFRLLSDLDDVTVVMTTQDGQRDEFPIVLRKESLRDLPTIHSVQFSQEGDLNSRVRYDLILERLAEDEKTFRLAVINLPREIDFAFLDQATNASLTQLKFSEEVTRQQLELELQIPEKLSRHFVDQTVEFYVLVIDQEGFGQLGELNRQYGDEPVALEDIRAIKGNKERFELIPRGKGALETIPTNRYQAVKIDEDIAVRVDLLNIGTLEVGGVHLSILPPMDWSYDTNPDTIARILPGEKESITIMLYPPAELGVSEHDVRVEAVGFAGNEKVEAQEKDITIRVEARARIVRSALVIGGVIVLVVGVAVVSIRVSRR